MTTEEIKKVLLSCSKGPQTRPFVCMRATALEEVLEKVKGLDYRNFVDVFVYSTDLNLPQDFQRELRFEAEKRGYEPNK